MDTNDLLRKARFMLHKCRSEGVEPLGWGINREMWDQIADSLPVSLWGTHESLAGDENKLYGLPVEVDDVYTDLSIRII